MSCFVDNIDNYITLTVKNKCGFPQMTRQKLIDFQVVIKFIVWLLVMLTLNFALIEQNLK